MSPNDPASAAGVTRGAFDPRAVRILVVDDEPSVLSFVDRALREAGYQTTVARDGGEALAAVAAFGPFDLLLTDVIMPSMSGDELARRVRQAHPEVKVLYLTGFTDALFKAKSALWSDEAFLEKPCSLAGLVEAVSLLLFGRLAPDARPADTR